MAKQIGFTLPVQSSDGIDEFYVSKCNKIAVDLLEDWKNWPNLKHTLSGPPASGKTHLGQIWAKQVNASYIDATTLKISKVDKIANTALVIDNISKINSREDLEEALFHLHNFLQERKLPFLLIGTGFPQFWKISLSDLMSRIEGTRNAQIDELDDKLLPLIMAKLFADRQMYPSPDVFEYLNRRMVRSFSAVNSIVADIDRISIEEKRPITRSLVAKIFKNKK
jgi:chromosomal replication initiation ATPase DnaA